MSGRLFTSESVTEGHPDKMADQVSDAILDAMLADDPASRVAVETLFTTGLVVVAGEVTTSTWVDIPQIVRDTVLRIGYDSSDKGFDGASCGVQIAIGKQSPDIAQGVDDAFEERAEGSGDPLDRQGAGDQGVFSPWSWWPLVIGAAAALVFAGLAVGWWLAAIGGGLAVIGLTGWVFEFSRGQHAH